MDRLEAENMVTITSLVEQDCVFALPVKSEFDLVDLNRCFVQGGSVSFTDKYRMSNSQACVLIMESFFPVPSCRYEEDENGEQTDNKIEIRGLGEASTMFGITNPQDLSFGVQSSSSFEPASDYEGSLSYQYWDRKQAINPFVSYTNILDECDISFYGEPKGTAFLCSWVNGGSVLCNNLNFTAIDLPAPDPDIEFGSFNEQLSRPFGAYIVIDGQDPSSIPEPPNNIPVETTIKEQTITFTNTNLSAEEQWYHAYFVAPLAYRLSFQNLLVYKMDLIAYNSTTERASMPAPPVERSELKEPDFDYGSMDGECKYYYSKIDAINVAGSLAGYLSFPSLECTKSEFTLPGKLLVEGDTILNDLTTIQCGEVEIADVQLDSSNLVIGGLGGKIQAVTLNDSLLNGENPEYELECTEINSSYSSVIVQKLNVEDLMAAENSTISIGTFRGDMEASYCQIDIDTFIGDCDFREQETFKMNNLYQVGPDGVFLRADGDINKVYNYGNVVVGGGSSVKVDEWYGNPPAVDNQSACVTGAYYPDLPPLP